jgi:CheY-like chemotaxis protein
MSRIMVVDDEPDILKLVKKVLERDGHEVLTAISGPMALKILKENEVELILIDYFMPEMSGGELCMKIRQEIGLNSVKMALLTVAEFSEIEEENLKEACIADYIKKPFDFDDLLRRVNKMLDS